MRTLTCLASALLVALSAACSANDTPDDRRGELDRMTFGFDGPRCFDGCSPTQAIATGAHVVVLAKGDDAEAAYHARSRSAGLVVEAEGLACRCRETSANGYSEGSLAPDEKCYAPAVRHCSRTVQLRADGAGPAVLEMLDATGAVVDRVALVVTEPARIAADFRGYRPTGGSERKLTPAADGALEIDAPMTINLDVIAEAADGSELRTTRSDFALTSDDMAIASFYGQYTTKQTAAAVHHVTATGLGLSAPFVVRVTPEL